MGRIKKFLSVMISACCVAAAIPGFSALADSNGEKVVTLGADLSAEQKTTMLKYFGIEGQDIKTLTVTNADERDLLGDFISMDEIGSRTYSCALVQSTTSGGIQVKTANLTYVSSDMIASALSTCGVVNCQVLAAAPFAVSGTGALTGVLMSYESSTGKQLKTKRVKAATREMITTARFGRRFGRPRATLIVNRAKIQVVRNRVTNVKEITNIINNVSAELNVSLSDEEVELLQELLQDISELSYTDEEIDQMQETVDQVEENANAELSAEEDSGDIMMYTDDSALGDDASFDSSGIMTLNLPMTDEELEYESEMGPEAEAESEADSEILAEAESEAEIETEAAADEEETLAESEASKEAEEEPEAAQESIFFNTDESILGDNVAIDMTIPEEDQSEALEESTEEPAQETEAEAAEETAEEADTESAEEADTESAEETEEEADSQETEESEEETKEEAEEAVPADPSAFLPEALTEAEAETESQDELTSFVIGGDMPEEESKDADADTDTSAEPAEADDDDNLFKQILSTVTEDGSGSDTSSAQESSGSEPAATSDDNEDDSFASLFGESADSTSDDIAADSSEEAAAPAASFTASDLSFSPNGSTVDPDLSSLSISCSAGGLSAGSGTLTVYTSDGAAVASVPMSSASVSSNSATVTIGAVLSPNTSYYVILSSDALKKDGVSLEGTSSGSWTFNTSGSDEPEEPAEGEEAVAEGDDYVDDWGDEDWGDDWDEDWDW